MYKVVIVDDEETIVKGLSSLLPWKEFDCEVVGTANDGESALELVRKHKPDILFTDIRMPGMDGLALIAALRSEYENMQISILSGFSEFDYAQKAIRLGVARYLLKPSKLKELESALEAMVDNLDRYKKKGKYRPEEIAEEKEEDDEKDEAASNFIIGNAIKYMEENYSEKLTLPLVAEQVYVSQWHLSKLIVKVKGQNFSELLNRIRIDKSKELLLNDDLRIWEISEMVGFSDVTHFSRTFKKLEDMSPNDFREKNR